jgi:ankyrin repeat protein
VTDRELSTPLHTAANQANMDACRLFLEHGARLESRDFKGRTPLMCAMESGSMFTESVCSFLIEKGADVNAKVKNGTMPLHLAIR